MSNLREVGDTGVSTYEATAEKYSPICLVGESGSGNSLNVWHTGGEIAGVALFDVEGNLLGHVGLVPPEEL